MIRSKRKIGKLIFCRPLPINTNKQHEIVNSLVQKFNVPDYSHKVRQDLAYKSIPIYFLIEDRKEMHLGKRKM